MTWVDFETSLSPNASPDDELPKLQRVLFGRFMRPDRSEVACTAAQVSPVGAELRGTAPPEYGARLIVYLEQLGRIEACTGVGTANGYVVQWLLTDTQRSKLCMKLRWLTDHLSDLEPDDRQYVRRSLQDTRSIIILMDGRRIPCEVTDISMTGAGIATQITVDVGERLYLGTLLCEVMRVTDTGYGLKFITGHGSDLMNQLVVKQPDRA